MITSTKEWQTELSTDVQKFIDILSKKYIDKVLPLKDTDPLDMIRCFEMYASVKDSLNHAVNKLHNNF